MKKIGYIKINSVNGQITFCVFELENGILFTQPNVHKNNTKKNNVIHLNVNTELFIDRARQIKQHCEMLIRVFLGLDLNKFKMLMHRLSSSTVSA